MMPTDDHNAPGRKYSAILRSPVSVSLLVLAAGLLITWWMWQDEQRNAMQVMQKRFDSRVSEFEKLAAIRVHGYEQVLVGMSGLFAAAKDIERSEFRKYVSTLKLDRSFPGAQGVYFSLAVPADQKDRHIAAIRSEGFPEYTIKPGTPRDFYTPTIFFEPFSELNRRVFGFDNFTDATQRAAMEQARDNGELSISGKSIQNHGNDLGQSDFRMYVPIYRNSASTLNPEERRKNILGWLYMPVRMDDLMRNALGEDAGLDVEIYDSDNINAEGLMYDSDPGRGHLVVQADALFKAINPIMIHGHTWTLAAHSLPNFDAMAEEGKPQSIIYTGAGISLLLSFLAGLLMHGRARIRHEAKEVAGSEARLFAVIETALDAVIQMDADGRVIGWNNQAEIVFGWSREMALGLTLEDMIIPEIHCKVYRASMKKFLVSPEEFTVSIKGSALNARTEISALRRDGTEFPVELSMTQNMLEDGSFQFTAFIRDITKQRERDEAQRLASMVLNTVEEAVMVMDPDVNIVKVNPAFTAITGYTDSEVIGKNPRILSAKKHTPEFHRLMWESINSKGLWQGEIWDRHKNGKNYIKWLTTKAVRDEKGVLTHYLGVFFDISERKAAEEQMKRLAHHDTLTDLPNRVLFNDRLQQAMYKVRRDDGYLALMFIDLDKFKPVNDTYGHAVGDLLLKEVATRLLDCVRESDTVCRIGGDEFVILLSTIEGESDATLVAGKVLHALSRPFDLTGLNLSISSSIGIAIYPEHGDDELQLTKNADLAMYHAKNDGRNNAKVYQPDMHEA